MPTVIILALQFTITPILKLINQQCITSHMHYYWLSEANTQQCRCYCKHTESLSRVLILMSTCRTYMKITVSGILMLHKIPQVVSVINTKHYGWNKMPFLLVYFFKKTLGVEQLQFPEIIFVVSAIYCGSNWYFEFSHCFFYISSTGWKRSKFCLLIEHNILP